MSDPDPGGTLDERLARIEAQQAQQLAVQREHLDLARHQYERAERLQDRAEEIQARSAALVRSARTVTLILVPLLFIALAVLVVTGIH